jgi:hypothetical protein
MSSSTQTPPPPSTELSPQAELFEDLKGLIGKYHTRLSPLDVGWVLAFTCGIICAQLSKEEKTKLTLKMMIEMRGRPPAAPPQPETAQ